MPITKERISEIEDIAETVLEEALDGERKLPIDIKEVVSKQGLTLQIGKFENKDVIGAYDRQAKTIFVSETEQYQRTAFTIAHELGHYILHSDRPSETFYRTDSYLQDLQDKDEETEANCFAAAILMPKDKVTHFSVWFDKEKLAELFGVSPIAMGYRLKNMGL